MITRLALGRTLSQGIFFRFLTASQSPAGGTLRVGKGTLTEKGTLGVIFIAHVMLGIIGVSCAGDAIFLTFHNANTVNEDETSFW